MEQNDNGDNDNNSQQSEDIDFDEEIIIDEVINDINIDDINNININNELMQNENRNIVSNNNLHRESNMENNSNNIDNQNNNSSDTSFENRDRQQAMNDLTNNILFNTRVDMMNILRDVLEDDNQDSSNNNLNSFSNLLNNIQSTLINASDRIPTIINEINDNLSSLEESNMEEDTEEENQNIRETTNNTVESQTNTLEGDYINLIQTGNLRAQINNPNRFTNTFESLDNTDDDNAESEAQMEADRLYALQLQQQEYRMATPNVNSLLRQRRTTISRPQQQSQQQQNTSSIRERTGAHLEHRDGMLRIRRRPISSDVQTEDLFGILGQSLFGPLSNQGSTGRSLRTFTDVMSTLVNPSERTYENIPVVLEQEEINNLKQIVFNDDTIAEGKHQKCTICLGPYEKDEKLTILPCGHGFHTNCINNWLKEYSYKCPICRSETGSGRPVFNNNIRNRRTRVLPSRRPWGSMLDRHQRYRSPSSRAAPARENISGISRSPSPPLPDTLFSSLNASVLPRVNRVPPVGIPSGSSQGAQISSSVSIRISATPESNINESEEPVASNTSTYENSMEEVD